MDATTARQQIELEITRLRALGRSGDLTAAEHGDAADDGADLYDREVERALDAEVLAELDALDAALARVEAGTYGRCEACAAPIPDERLEAVPATRFCRAHEDEAETHLGARTAGDDRDPAEAVRREAQAHLSMVADDEGGAERADREVGAEDGAVHVRPG